SPHRAGLADAQPVLPGRQGSAALRIRRSGHRDDRGAVPARGAATAQAAPARPAAPRSRRRRAASRPVAPVIVSAADGPHMAKPAAVMFDACGTLFVVQSAVVAGPAVTSDPAILSNGSPRMLMAAVSSSGLEGKLAHVLSVDAVRAYKPTPAVYELGPRAFRAHAREILFVSSNAWDVAGARAFGYRTCWCNRAQMPMD